MNFFQRLVIALLVLAVTACDAEPASYRLETFATGLEKPWSLAFLPDGSALVTEHRGELRRVSADGELGPPIENVPEVYFRGQGGLFDVLPHPDFAQNRVVYLSFAEGTSSANHTAVARGRLVDNQLEDVEVIFRNRPEKTSAGHFGGRMVFLPDGNLLLTTGDGQENRESAQDIKSGLGKVLRMKEDGSPAEGNPFPDSPYVYSYGHRNPQGLALARDGTIWTHEHGAKGGDEINRIEPGVNYGWPAITFGINYNGDIISPHTALPGMAQPQHYWVPSIAPCGLTVYHGALFPEWEGDLFVGALAGQLVKRVKIRDDHVVEEETLLDELGVRIRDIRTGPDGALYVLTNGLPGKIIRILPPQ